MYTSVILYYFYISQTVDINYYKYLFKGKLKKYYIKRVCFH